MPARIACLFTFVLALSIYTTSETAAAAPESVSALGRLEPEHGIIRVASPSTPQAAYGAVLAALRVEEGDDVEQGQLLAAVRGVDLDIEQGEVVEWGGHTFELVSVDERTNARESRIAANVVLDGEKTYRPAVTTYLNLGADIGTPSVRTGFTKDVYLMGGWDASFTTRDPSTNVTTLDAGGSVSAGTYSWTLEAPAGSAAVPSSDQWSPNFSARLRTSPW